MKISKAIEILTIELSAFPHKGTEDWYDSVKLGIEALKHHKKLRDAHPYSNYKILPGETKE